MAHILYQVKVIAAAAHKVLVVELRAYLFLLLALVAIIRSLVPLFVRYAKLAPTALEGFP